MTDPTPIANAASNRGTDARATQMEAHAQLVLQTLQSQYRLLLDNQGVSTVARVVSPGVLKTVSKDYVVEQSLIRLLGDRATVSDIRNEVFPRWCSEMRARPGVLCIDSLSVKPFHFLSDPLAAGWAWQRLPWDPDPQAPIPETFAAICSRTSPDEARALTLYLGSLFDYQFPREQYLYLYGAGGDGKSRIIEASTVMFANQGYATMGADDLGNSHSTSVLEGVRLLTFPDLKKPSLPSSGIFKQLTGDDIMTVNPKGLPLRNIRLACKVIISSNVEPKLDGGPADMRRLVYVRLAKHEGGADHSFKARCVEQAHSWARYCYAQYQAWRAQNPISDLPTAHDAVESVQVHSVEAEAQSLIDSHLEFGPDFRMPAHALYTHVQRLSQGNYALEQTVYAQLKRMPKVSKRRLPATESVTRAPAWFGVRAKNLASPFD